MSTAKEIIIYRPNEQLQLQVRLEDETIWLTQTQIADLFAVQRPAITKHLGNIFASHELEESSVSSILEHTAQDAPIKVNVYKKAHDRFLIIDEVVFHIGASLKDLGKKLFAFSKMHTLSADELITRIN